MLRKVAFSVVLGAVWLMAAAAMFGLPRAYAETEGERDRRMQWWREARFGMFIHWGVYCVPAGEWKGKKDYGEWFLEQTRMPVSQYETYRDQFNPVKFDAKRWVELAKAAGMKYLVITSKHHDGFAMFDTKLTDWGVLSTPWRHDPLKDLAEACRKAGIRFCVYYSIMDWHHPDYPQRRAWNDVAQGRPDLDRYVKFMKGQLRELVDNYRPSVLWFDGEWEDVWTHERGKDLDSYCRGLKLDVIVNNRVGKNREGMAGLSKGDEIVGDFGTPEQQIPATGLPGVDWEACMTMNDHWGYNKNDCNWKSSATLIRDLVDIAGKGGNFLLNVGPTPEGLIPKASVNRLTEIGRWMRVNGESVYGTSASPFAKPFPWGRCTKKTLPDGKTRLYLHVFDWPAHGKLTVPRIGTASARASMLGDPRHAALNITRGKSDFTIDLPGAAPDSIDSVVVLDLGGAP